MGRCNKGVECSYCHEAIEVGEPEVFGKLWRQYGGKDGKSVKWVKVFHWHSKRKDTALAQIIKIAIDNQMCWVIQALDNFGKTVHVETRGRKKLILPKEKRDGRLKLLRKRAKVIQQLKIVMEEHPKKRNMDEVVRLGLILEKLRVDIEQFGGVPKSWG